MMIRFRSHGICLALAALAAAGIAGCKILPTSQPGPDFVSANPEIARPPLYERGGEPTPEDTGEDEGGEAERAIAEADIIQIEGDRLYALSQYSGLSVVDISNTSELRLLGRHRLAGVPFEMYLRGGVVYAMFSSWGSYEFDEAAGSYRSIQTSHIEALDVSNPESVRSIGSFDLPGSLSDSRIVGDVLYVVTFENGSCWGCKPTPNTTITSLSVGDPSTIGIVDQLRYGSEDPFGYGWQRSVTVTTERMYVAGVAWSGSGEGRSTIQVVDISDPTGALIEGDTIEAAGVVQSRWQMDEHEGVLRVVSQPGTWWADTTPSVETFTIASSNELEPLGKTELVLPRPEMLRSARFDGPRAYVITAEQVDPLFAIDLSDPANPRQVGELEMPGWVFHIEPRGDRLYALGFDNANAEGSLHVSIFDVADMERPEMLDRVAFGGQWAGLAEDQDRIHKAFNVLEDQGLVFVPFSGWEYADEKGCGSYRSGIQIIEIEGDDLERRGVAPSHGQARRAFLHEGALFAMSDVEVGTFSIADRDAPEPLDRLPLAAIADRAVAVGDVVVRLSADWWTSEARLEVALRDDPGHPEPIGAVDLATLAADDEAGCYGMRFWDARLFSRGDHVWLVWPSVDGSSTHIATIDVQDAAHPAIAGQLRLAARLDLYGPGYGAVVSSGEAVVQLEDKLALRRFDQALYDRPWTFGPAMTAKAWVEVVDLSNPKEPRHAATVELPEAAGYTGLLVEGESVVTSHWVPLAEDRTKARFYFDRVDLTDASAPDAHVPVNVPGSLAGFDEETSRVLTIDYQWITAYGITQQACWRELGGDAVFEPRDPDAWDGIGRCRAIHRDFKLVDVQAGKAMLRDESAIPEGTYLSNLLVGEDRAFVMANSPVWYVTDERQAESGQTLLVVAGLREGALQVESIAGEKLGDAFPAAVAGTHLFLTSYSPPALWMLDATDMDALAFEKLADLPAYAQQVTIAGDIALAALGPYGLEAVDIDVDAVVDADPDVDPCVQPKH